MKTDQFRTAQRQVESCVKGKRLSLWLSYLT